MQYLTPSEKEKLLRAVYSETGKHRKRNIAIFEVGLYCALRVSETLYAIITFRGM